MRFVAPDEGALSTAPPGLLGVHFDKPDLLRLMETGLFGVIALLGLLLVLRPMVQRLTALGPALAGPIGAPGGTIAGAFGGALAGTIGGALGTQAGAALLAEGGLATLPGIGGAAGTAALGADRAQALLEDESMLSVANVEGQMRASSIRRVAGLVEKHPEETVTIMRGWMAQEAG
jgi:flagellar M-ring protein FliF